MYYANGQKDIAPCYAFPGQRAARPSRFSPLETEGVGAPQGAWPGLRQTGPGVRCSRASPERRALGVKRHAPRLAARQRGILAFVPLTVVGPGRVVVPDEAARVRPGDEVASSIARRCRSRSPPSRRLRKAAKGLPCLIVIGYRRLQETLVAWELLAYFFPWTVADGFRRLPPKQPHGQTHMPRNIRSKLESRSVRLALKPHRQPVYERIGRGVWLGYRRTKTAGTWLVRCVKDGPRWTKRFADADDYEESNQKSVMTYFEAQTYARTLAGAGKDGTATLSNRPVTVGEAVDDYEADLKQRGKDTRNALVIRFHLKDAKGLANIVVSALEPTDFKPWNQTFDGLVYTTTNRVNNADRKSVV